MKTDAELLTEARELIQNGWVQKNTHVEINGQHSYCSAGAIIRAIWGRNPHVPDAERKQKNQTFDRLTDLIRRAVGESESIVLWNDAPGRTKDEVLQAFSTAIESADK